MENEKYRVLFLGRNGDWILDPDVCDSPEKFYNLDQARDEKRKLLERGFDKSVVLIIRSVE